MKYALLLCVCLTLIVACQQDAGPADAPPPADLLLPVSALPDYEAQVDHAGMIQALDEDALRRGAMIYGRTCFNCHGNPDQPGAIPNAHRFWADTFRHGQGPYALYQTLSQGFGRMPPQIQLVPREKYDVIHYIRETFVKHDNPGQYAPADSAYLAALPAGSTQGPEPREFAPWAEMDYGRFLINTYEVADTSAPAREISRGPSPLPNENYADVNFAYKGIALRLDPGAGGVAAGKVWAVYDHDLMRVAGVWTGEGFIDWEGILLNGAHNIYPRTQGRVLFDNPVGPGWAHPVTGSFEDTRMRGLDNRPFGPLPLDWVDYKGLYHHGDQVVLAYTVGKTPVWESMALAVAGEQPVLARNLTLGENPHFLKMRIAPEALSIAVQGATGTLEQDSGYHMLRIPPGEQGNVRIYLSQRSQASLDAAVSALSPPEDLRQYTQGGPAHYPERLQSNLVRGKDEGAYTVDVLSLPIDNPWKSRMRLSGIDFLPETDEALVCTVEGEVWKVGGITQAAGALSWQRIATGLFQPLGIKVRDGDIFVTCRDQLVRLVDLNGDGETDFYESFNHDHQVTEHYHEFAMGLQTDEEGNFYYAKSARHARTSLIPQHGTLLKVSADGSRTDIIAHGFRAANGVCRNPDGSFFVTDQEGHWNPMNRINWVEEGGFYGNMYGYGAGEDTADAAMIPPLCWVDRDLDRSPSELLWADSEQWGPLNGALLNLSYGYGKLFVVLHEEIAGQPQGLKYQGGMVALPIPDFPTGVMRGRFHPKDGQLYACGMNAWGSSQVLQDGGLYRVRYTGQSAPLPVGIEMNPEGVTLTFSDPLDRSSAESVENYHLETWALKRTHRYGSGRYDRSEWELASARLANDGQTLFLEIPDIAPAWTVALTYRLKAASGKVLEQELQFTIYTLAGEPLVGWVE